MTTPLQVPGLIRRVRREADLSQRDLASRVGVDQSVVARWETGELVPTVAMLERVLDVGGFRLAVLGVPGERGEATAGEAAPMRSDAVRDRQHRRFPSHLDVHDLQDDMTGDHRPHAPWRGRRDRVRATTGVVPVDHPTGHELREGRARAVARRRAVLAERVRRLPEWTPLAQGPPCACPSACWVLPGCTDACPCRCEATTTARGRAQAPWGPSRSATLALL